MNKKIISDITSLEVKPNALRFSIVFMDTKGKKKEFIFFDYSIRQCVIKSISLFNYMFRYGGMKTVYIYPTSDTTVLRTVYRKTDGDQGDYKIVKCPIEGRMTLEFVRAQFIDE